MNGCLCGISPNKKLKMNFEDTIQEEASYFKCTMKFEKLDKISVHPLSDDPDEYVDSLKKNPSMCYRVTSKSVDPIPLDAPKPEGHTRFVCISDTHSLHREMQHLVPSGDVLLHCGDFTDVSKLKEVEEFNEWLAELPHKHKIVIGGNHELAFDQKIMETVRRHARNGTFVWIPQEKTDNWPNVLNNCLYLQDAEVSVNGIRIYGCPWNPEFGGWGFNTDRGEALLEKWNKIPGDGIDILMTHSPPAGFLDAVHPHNERVGCVELLNTVQMRVQPKYHVFGHIHEAYGYETDGYHNFINCSIINRRHDPCHKPVIIDIPTPAGAPEGLGEVIQY